MDDRLEIISTRDILKGRASDKSDLKVLILVVNRLAELFCRGLNPFSKKFGKQA